MLDRLEPELQRSVFTHSSWTTRRSESYERLAFLGDSVLGLAVTNHLFPRLDAERFGPGRLTKIRAQAVSGRSCRAVAERLGVPDRLRAAAPETAAVGLEALIATERVLASVIEAVIGACYVTFGYDATAEVVVDAFAPEIEDALEHSVDYKSALQERLARRGELVSYAVVDEQGPPHDRTFTVQATIRGKEIGSGVGRSKKDAEQEAAQSALSPCPSDEPRGSGLNVLCSLQHLSPSCCLSTDISLHQAARFLPPHPRHVNTHHLRDSHHHLAAAGLVALHHLPPLHTAHSSTAQHISNFPSLSTGEQHLFEETRQKAAATTRNPGSASTTTRLLCTPGATSTYCWNWTPTRPKRRGRRRRN